MKSVSSDLLRCTLWTLVVWACELPCVVTAADAVDAHQYSGNYYLTLSTTSVTLPISAYSGPGRVLDDRGALVNGSVKYQIEANPLRQGEWFLFAVFSMHIQQTNSTTDLSPSGVETKLTDHKVNVATFRVPASQVSIISGDSDTIKAADSNWSGRSLNVSPGVTVDESAKGASNNGVVKNWHVSWNQHGATVELRNPVKIHAEMAARTPLPSVAPK